MLFSTRTARPADAEALSDIASQTFALASPADSSAKALAAISEAIFSPNTSACT
ncbi:hypothetical protein NWF32_23750 [Pseudomonas qingdaonensis]|nr:hypothetical protein [Pseudomonas qingdaonensis]